MTQSRGMELNTLHITLFSIVHCTLLAHLTNFPRYYCARLSVTSALIDCRPFVTLQKLYTNAFVPDKIQNKPAPHVALGNFTWVQNNFICKVVGDNSYSQHCFTMHYDNILVPHTHSAYLYVLTYRPSTFKLSFTLSYLYIFTLTFTLSPLPLYKLKCFKFTFYHHVLNKHSIIIKTKIKNSKQNMC